MYEHYWYTYTADGKLDSIYYSEVTAPGYVAYCKEDGNGFVWIDYRGSDGVHPSKIDNQYNNLTQDSTNLPTTLATSLVDGVEPNVSNPGYGYNFFYKATGQFDGFQQTATFVTGLLIGMGVEYNATGDVSTMTYNTTTGPRSTSTVTASGYDGHPSPYTGIAGWVFLTPAVNWTGSVYEPLLYALSPHNPGTSVFDGGAEGKWIDQMTYEYNTEGYPTTRTVVTADPKGSATTYTNTYTYKCQ